MSWSSWNSDLWAVEEVGCTLIKVTTFLQVCSGQLDTKYLIWLPENLRNNTLQLPAAPLPRHL